MQTQPNQYAHNIEKTIISKMIVELLGFSLFTAIATESCSNILQSFCLIYYRESGDGLHLKQ